MYIRKSTRTYKEKTYTNHLLVESIQTPKGPRQRIICSLGSLEPGPAEEWLGLAHKLQSALQGQESLPESSEQIQEWVEKARSKKRGTTPPEEDRSELTVTVQADKLEIWTGCIQTANTSSANSLTRKRRCSTWTTPSICMT